MYKNLARALLCAIAAALIVPHAGAGVGPPLKVAFVYVSPIGDAGWTYQHDLGRRAMEQALGVKVRTTVRRIGRRRAGRRA
jgi:simple sugar transport system substrate-binding protein